MEAVRARREKARQARRLLDSCKATCRPLMRFDGDRINGVNVLRVNEG